MTAPLDLTARGGEAPLPLPPPRVGEGDRNPSAAHVGEARPFAAVAPGEGGGHAGGAPGGCDAVVIGGGVNGLVAAAALARAGRRVVLVEASDRLGGMAAERGAGSWAHLMPMPGPAMAADLRRHGVGWDGPVGTLSLDPGGRAVRIDGDAVAYADGGAHGDAAAYAALMARLRRIAGVLAPLADRAPPALAGGGGWGEVAALAGIGLRLRALGRAEMREALRLVLSNSRDMILDAVPDGPLAGALALRGALGGAMAPRAPGSVLPLVARLAQGADWVRPRGGMGAVVAALAAAAGRAGVALRTGARAVAVAVADDRVAGVRLASGEVLAAPLVLSTLGAMATHRLAGIAAFDAETWGRLRQIRARGVTAHLGLELAAAPQVAGVGGLEGARLVLAPSIAAIEAALRPAKYGEMSVVPVLEAVLLPGPRLSVLVHYAPHDLAGGWTAAARALLVQRVVAALGAVLPGLAGLVRGHALATPADIAAETGAAGGHWHQGEMAPDQMLMLRPIVGAARYATALPGLWLAGAAAHPGGDLTGAPGRIAARLALAQAVAR